MADFWKKLSEAYRTGLQIEANDEYLRRQALGGFNPRDKVSDFGSTVISPVSDQSAPASFFAPASFTIPGALTSSAMSDADASSPSPARSSAKREQLAYLDAPYAAAYGMDASTAYQEALAGSAHQREVADLLKAGLSPVLAANGGGASSFGGTVYAPSGSSARTVSKADSIGNIVGGIFSIITKNSGVGNGAKAIIKGLSELSP